MQRFESKRSVSFVMSPFRVHGKRISQTHMIIQREDGDQMTLLPVKRLVKGCMTEIKMNDTTVLKTDLKSRKQERGRVIQLGK